MVGQEREVKYVLSEKGICRLQFNYKINWALDRDCRTFEHPNIAFSPNRQSPVETEISFLCLILPGICHFLHHYTCYPLFSMKLQIDTLKQCLYDRIQ